MVSSILARANAGKAGTTQQSRNGVSAEVTPKESVLFSIPIPLPASVRAAWNDLPASLRRGVIRVVANLLRAKLGDRFREAGPGWAPLTRASVASKVARGLPSKNKRGQVFRRLRQDGNEGAAGTATAPSASVPTQQSRTGGSAAHAILIASGRLRDSYRVKSHPDHIERIKEDAEGLPVLVMGSGVPYGPAHQAGVSYVKATGASVLVRAQAGRGRAAATSSVAGKLGRAQRDTAGFGESATSRTRRANTQNRVPKMARSVLPARPVRLTGADMAEAQHAVIRFLLDNL